MYFFFFWGGVPNHPLSEVVVESFDRFRSVSLAVTLEPIPGHFVSHGNVTLWIYVVFGRGRGWLSF